MMGTLIVGKQQLQYPRTIVSNFGNLIKNDLKCDRCKLQRVCHNVLTVLREKSRFIDQSFECAFVFKLFLNAFTPIRSLTLITVHIKNLLLFERGCRLSMMRCFLLTQTNQLLTTTTTRHNDTTLLACCTC